MLLCGRISGRPLMQVRLYMALCHCGPDPQSYGCHPSSKRGYIIGCRPALDAGPSGRSVGQERLLPRKLLAPNEKRSNQASID